jgi:membrane protease YdiL (CAAX protease family)
MEDTLEVRINKLEKMVSRRNLFGWSFLGIIGALLATVAIACQDGFGWRTSICIGLPFCVGFGLAFPLFITQLIRVAVKCLKDHGELRGVNYLTSYFKIMLTWSFLVKFVCLIIIITILEAFLFYLLKPTP